MSDERAKLLSHLERFVSSAPISLARVQNSRGNDTIFFFSVFKHPARVLRECYTVNVNTCSRALHARNSACALDTWTTPRDAAFA